MKEIRAIIRPNKLPKLRTVLREMPGFPGMSVAKVEGFGAPRTHAPHNIKEELTDYSAKVRIEIVSPDELVDEIVRRIINVACTGQTGDGLVWVVPVDRAVFINKTTVGSPHG
ncbi:MAG: P-II family nitrogen regulator [Methyloversatilis sp.]|jgi:nitrogen regulatory protein P-II 1|uniref:Nitrogen regulatory protein P-II n=1 Tax=Methyloversatilis universalis (strain ATCC BAA-1314 / DSM 25237 / JCM 13912 / CCUG 52030 / FAM5) TaxID=1000565 RepID=F5RG31_METUF|nr:P-II family nitrogen regulator [Methyloversatilis universalis]EGK70519.1 Nitrogen regulatory protein P-II [Methyloversatilis universalis FAM5]MCP4638729.1 P-II family nitrogen regulator [Methyloversatilis sp.]